MKIKTTEDYDRERKRLCDRARTLVRLIFGEKLKSLWTDYDDRDNME